MKIRPKRYLCGCFFQALAVTDVSDIGGVTFLMDCSLIDLNKEMHSGEVLLCGSHLKTLGIIIHCCFVVHGSCFQNGYIFPTFWYIAKFLYIVDLLIYCGPFEKPGACWGGGES